MSTTRGFWTDECTDERLPLSVREKLVLLKAAGRGITVEGLGEFPVATNEIIWLVLTPAEDAELTAFRISQLEAL